MNRRLKQIWAPWRSKYVMNNEISTETKEFAGTNCFLCDISTDPPIQDDLVLHKSENSFIILNKYPYTPGHILISPYAHQSDILESTEEELLERAVLVNRSINALTREYNPDGFNIGMNLGSMAGAGLPGHLHIHVVPRWGGDTNFMPVISEVKVLPETLLVTKSRLLPHFN